MPIVIDAPESSPALMRLPAFLGLCALVALPLQAQEAGTTVQPGAFMRTPTGVQLGTIMADVALTIDSTAGSWRHVTLEGWIFTASTQPDRREGFDLSVRVSPTENLRASPNGTIVARLQEGALLNQVRTQGGWTLVRRSGWIPERSLPLEETLAVDADPSNTDPNQVEMRAETSLLTQPGGAALGALAAGSHATVIARSGQWARVQVEGWVHQDSIASTSGGARIGVTAAEVRANPERYIGQVVDWNLQLVAVQTADELRPEVPLGQRYLLTRGPAPEIGFVYVLLDDEEAGRLEALQPLQDLVLRVKILAARTRYLPNPVVDLQQILDSGP